ncbi:hypothetical protein PCANC_21897 [Puccinia coronata f. sp. avenae]|uniref:Uncharacterized protein n=1 Tax=Puccinia coronata f. sp. avenae TaxID=200324 RepID=A0A2N5U7T5_9BASI|nr:hypothetical protein PCANC_21897 [Puccinia coronata f. sp. avenae]
MIADKSSQQGITLDLGVNAETGIGNLGATGSTPGSTIAKESFITSSLVPASAKIAAQIQAQATQQRTVKSLKSKATAAPAKPCSKARKVPTVTDNQPQDPDDLMEERDVDLNILDILGTLASVETSLLTESGLTILASVPTSSEQSPPKGEKASMFALAMENETAGNKDRADMFFMIYERLIQTAMTPEDDLMQAHAKLPSLTLKRPADQVTSTTTSSKEKRTKRPLFDPSVCNRHTNLGFTHYFDRNF